MPMIELSPRSVLRAITNAIPDECRGDITVIGSLAAGYHFFRNKPGMQVRTKDVDFVVSPMVKAVSLGKNIAERLLTTGWTHRVSGTITKPGTATTPDYDLPAIRLNPPGSTGWFVEILTVPESENQMGPKWTRVELSTGHYGMPAFRFSSLMVFEPLNAESGLHYARPELMALANLLEHHEIRPDVMSSLIDHREIRRSNKDLGRVLAIARLSGDEVQQWPQMWKRALQETFPSYWQSLASETGAGLRALLGSEEDLEQAAWANNTGLLASEPASPEELKFTALRLLQDAIEPFESIR